MNAKAVAAQWTGALLPSETELSDTEIASRYGVLIEDAVSAFRQDPGYVVNIAECASRLKEKRQKTWGVVPEVA